MAQEQTIKSVRSRESVFSEWSEELLKIRRLESELRRAKERRNQLEKKYPYLGSIKGILRSKKEAQEKEVEEKKTSLKRPAEGPARQRVPKKWRKQEDPDLRRAIYQYKQELNRLFQKASSGKKLEKVALEKVVRSAGSFGLPIPEEKEIKLREAAGVSPSEFISWFEQAESNLRTIADENGKTREVDSSLIPLYIPSGSRDQLHEMEIAEENNPELEQSIV